MTALILLALAGTATFSTEVGVGGDYTTQRYTTGDYDTLTWIWEEDDTLDTETEGRTGLTFRFALDSGGTRLDANNTASLSTRSVRDALGFSLEQELGPALSLRAGNDAELRHYHGWFPAFNDTAYGGRDYWNNTSRLELRWQAAEALRLTLSDGFDLLRYAEPDSWYYNYYLNRARLAGWWEPGFFTTVDFGAGWTRRWAPEDEDRDYDDGSASAGAEHSFDSGLRLAADNELTRRRYRGVGWNYWADEASATVGTSIGAVGLEVENDAAWTVYDSTTSVYASLFEDGLRLTVSVPVGLDLTLRAGPRADVGIGLAGHGDDDYREWSAFVGADWFNAGRFWLSFEDRLGRRNYPYADTTWQSNYVFNEFSLFGSWTVLAGAAGELRLEGMASVTPEWHARTTDDFALAVYSLELKYGF